MRTDPEGEQTASFLAGAVAHARERTTEDERKEPLAAIRRRALASPRPPGFAEALSGAGVAVIAEVKRASPSRGQLAAIPDAGGLARAYAEGGAAAVSVLTEPRSFRGCLADLLDVAAAVSVPVLRKDFVVEPYQVFQARAAGAAAVLLIVAALERDALAELLGVVAEAQLEALVEVHDHAELATAVNAYEQAGRPARLALGINARDLATLTVDTAVFSQLRGVAPADALLVAESGVQGPDDVRARAREGADAVLVGEHVARAADPAAAVGALVAAGTGSSGATLHPSPR